ncbi:MAG: TolC family protein [Thermoanaerobaculia bacterium]
MSRSLRLLTILGLLLAPLTAVAQEQAPPQEPTPAIEPETQSVPDALDDEEDPRALRLSLGETIRATVENNLGVRLNEYDYRITGEQARSALGLFDWNTFATASLGDFQPAAEEAPIIESMVFNAGVRQDVSTGGGYTLSFNNSEQTVFEPAYESEFNFALNQPLLRDFGVDVTRRQINIARNTLGISEEAFRNALMFGVRGAEQAYYDLIFARENLEVVQQSLELAVDQARITQIRIDVGASAPLDILEPRVAIATREEQVISAEALVRDAEDRLRRWMNLPASEWDRPIIPTDPIEYTPVEVDLEASVARAYELKPQVRQAALNTQIEEIEYLYARNQVLPQLDLRLNYGVAGAGGTQIIRDPQTNEPIGVVRGEFSDALDQVFGMDFPSWTATINVGVPIRNITRRAQRRAAQLDLERAVQSREDVEQEIAVFVRQAARSIETAARQIAASQAAREAAEQNLEAERRRFENGMSTNFDVLRVQQQLTEARSRELAAVVDYNQAVTEYHFAVGDLLQMRGIDVDARTPDYELPHSTLERVDWLNFGYWAD